MLAFNNQNHWLIKHCHMTPANRIECTAKVALIQAGSMTNISEAFIEACKYIRGEPTQPMACDENIDDSDDDTVYVLGLLLNMV